MPTDVDTGLPQMVLRDGSTLTIDTGDAAALVTAISVSGFSNEAAQPLDPGPLGGAYFAGDELTT